MDDEIMRWVEKTFRRDGSELILGKVDHALALDREHVDLLVDHLEAIRITLPTLDQRLDGLTTCDHCDGAGEVDDPETGDCYTCPACGGEGLVDRKASDF